jgi:hypothetical protein
MRRLLYSKWFFLILAVVCVVDLLADAGEIWGRGFLKRLAIGMDFAALPLSGWIFIDLHARRPKNGNHTRGR